MVNRRVVLGGLFLLPFGVPSFAADEIVPKGIRFLSGYDRIYDKTCWYNPGVVEFSDFAFWQPDTFTPAPLSVYREQIELQRELGFQKWEIIK